MEKLTKAVLLLSPLILLAMFVSLTDPYELPIPLLLVPFLLLGLGCYRLIVQLLKTTPMPARKRFAIAAAFTSILLLVVLLQSIRQLSVKDFLIMAVLLAGTTFYVRRIDM